MAALGIVLANLARERGGLINDDEYGIRRLAEEQRRQTAQKQKSKRQFPSYALARGLRLVPARHSRQSAVVAFTMAVAAM
jgi:hypothetical protein